MGFACCGISEVMVIFEAYYVEVMLHERVRVNNVLRSTWQERSWTSSVWRFFWHLRANARGSLEVLSGDAHLHRMLYAISRGQGVWISRLAIRSFLKCSRSALVDYVRVRDRSTRFFQLQRGGETLALVSLHKEHDERRGKKPSCR